MNLKEDNQVYKGKITKKNNATKIIKPTDKNIKTKFDSITMQKFSYSNLLCDTIHIYIHRLTYQLILNQLNDRMTR